VLGGLAHGLGTGASITVAFVFIGVHSDITPKAFDSRALGRRAPWRSRGQRRTLGKGMITHDYAEGVIQMGEYITNQKEHHKHESFQDEFRRLCKKYGVTIDERYVWN
jgi:hypothetical protein